MKKLLTTLACVTTLVSTLSADIARVEMGAGAWGQTPQGYIDLSDGSGVLNLNGKYTSNETTTSDIYVWALIKHPVPIIPNLRLEYVTVTDEGDTTGVVGGITIPGSANTTLKSTQLDIVPYYNILDNTFWTTIDLGFDVKVIQTDSNVASVGVFSGYSSQDTTIIPLLYVRTRVEVPFTGIGFEVDAKAISDGTNTMYDARAKVDYTLTFIPVIQPAFEIGYRVQQLTVDDGDNQIDLNYAGVYAGLMLRF
ncbi:TIGR04219 family outer membrane beta-barrel protein [Sulfurimonas sp. SAG-AH-194-L11]|nr:TIGR04219 family outer membrane beta-barrel protein [Sulfurimonas sp. SAG-AH-194-L11]MDF1876231.1 TIGR04219 family outer membrane beta-barrel protein [Sulfurimonas sp. SAG-AH-194-L11]